MIPRVGSGGVVRCQDYQVVGKFSNNPQPTTTTLEDGNDVVRICRRIEQAMKRGKIEGSTMDSRTVMRGESGDDFDSVKP